jgi:hypothetical protein
MLVAIDVCIDDHQVYRDVEQAKPLENLTRDLESEQHVGRQR